MVSVPEVLGYLFYSESTKNPVIYFNQRPSLPKNPEEDSGSTPMCLPLLACSGPFGKSDLHQDFHYKGRRKKQRMWNSGELIWLLSNISLEKLSWRCLWAEETVKGTEPHSFNSCAFVLFCFVCMFVHLSLICRGNQRLQFWVLPSLKRRKLALAQIYGFWFFMLFFFFNNSNKIRINFSQMCHYILKYKLTRI